MSIKTGCSLLDFGQPLRKNGKRLPCEVMHDENAKLREERDHWHVEQVHAYGNWEDAHKRAAELELENAKLRELVREMYEDQCDECDRWRYRDRMHEIGIEAES